jgi:hypothetical protein
MQIARHDGQRGQIHIDGQRRKSAKPSQHHQQASGHMQRLFRRAHAAAPPIGSWFDGRGGGGHRLSFIGTSRPRNLRACSSAFAIGIVDLEAEAGVWGHLK